MKYPGVPLLQLLCTARLCMLFSAGLSSMIRVPSPHGLEENEGKEVSPFCFISDAGNLTQ